MTESRSRTAESITGSSLRDAERDDLVARVELLVEENRRLRSEYVRARRAVHRREALGLAGLGLVAAVAAVVYPESRFVLFALAGTGLFAAVLTYFLTPERFIAASVGERSYRAFAASLATLVEELELQDRFVYVPVSRAGEPFAGVRLYVPLYPGYEIPDDAALESTLVVTDEERQRGVSLYPTGAALFGEFEATIRGSVADDPFELAHQLCEALEEDFELVSRARPEVAPDGDRVTVAITGSVYGPVDRFDHPVASFLATGFAVGLDRPTVLETTAADDDRAEFLVTCSPDVPAGDRAGTQ